MLDQLPAREPEAYKGADKVSYNRPWHTALDDNGRELVHVRRVPDDPLPGGERVRRELHQRRRRRPSPGSLLIDHKVFLSTGHDEYWSGQQRANVEAARDAGVNLAFFSGNEVFWKTRWEPSIDGSNTAEPDAGDLQGDALRRSRRSAGPAHLDGHAGWTRGSARRATAGTRRTR